MSEVDATPMRRAPTPLMSRTPEIGRRRQLRGASIDLDDGAPDSASIHIRTRANTWLGTIFANSGSGSSPMAVLFHDGEQDQIAHVPLPAPLAMGLAGLAAVGLSGGLLRKR
jgi:hypothetical protein